MHNSEIWLLWCLETGRKLMSTVNLAILGSLCCKISFGGHLFKKKEQKIKAHTNGFANNRVGYRSTKQKQKIS